MFGTRARFPVITLTSPRSERVDIHIVVCFYTTIAIMAIAAARVAWLLGVGGEAVSEAGGAGASVVLRLVSGVGC